MKLLFQCGRSMKNKMLVVLDTNVFISALLSSKGPPAELIKRWEADEFGVVLSQILINELKPSLAYPRIKKYLKASEQTIGAIIDKLGNIAAVVEPQVELDVIGKDPEDNRLLECAIAGGAAYIISGDAHLLDLKEYQGIVILPPAGFLTLLRTED